MRKPVPNQKILLVGAPRTGSTWLSKYLSHSPSVVYNHEPDNELESPLAESLKAGLPRFPYLLQTGTTVNYKKLFLTAFSYRLLPNDHIINSLALKYIGLGRETKIKNLAVLQTASPQSIKTLYWISTLFSRPIPLNKMVLVKSVHLALALPFIKEHFNPTFILVFRNPLDAYGSQVKLQMKDQNRKIYKYHPDTSTDANYISKQSEAFQSGVQMALLYKSMASFAEKNNRAHSIFYEDIIHNPKLLPALAENLGISESTQMKHFLTKNNQPGHGYQISRDLKQQQNTHIGILSKEQIHQFKEGFHYVNALVYQNL